MRRTTLRLCGTILTLGFFMLAAPAQSQAPPAKARAKEKEATSQDEKQKAGKDEQKVQGQAGQEQSAPRKVAPGFQVPDVIGRHRYLAMSMAEDLKLTTEQRAKWEKAFENAFEEWTKLRRPGPGLDAELAPLKREMILARRADNRRRIIELRQEMSQIRMKYDIPHPVELLAERARPILNDEQKAKLPELVEKYGPDNLRRVRAAAAPPDVMLGFVREIVESPEQKKQLKAVRDRFADRIKSAAEKGEDTDRELNKELKHALADILTVLQLEDFEEMIANWKAERRAEMLDQLARSGTKPEDAGQVGGDGNKKDEAKKDEAKKDDGGGRP